MGAWRALGQRCRTRLGVALQCASQRPEVRPERPAARRPSACVPQAMKRSMLASDSNASDRFEPHRLPESRQTAGGEQQRLRSTRALRASPSHQLAREAARRLADRAGAVGGDQRARLCDRAGPLEHTVLIR